MSNSTSRRHFLRTLAGAAAGIGVGGLAPPSVAAAGRAPLPSLSGLGSRLPDEPFWEAVKARFPLRDGIVPMNAANLAPAPRATVDAMIATMYDLEGDVSHQNRAKFSDVLETARSRLAAFLGANADEIAIVRNASEANNIIVGGLPLGPGDEVLLFDQNHQTNHVAWTVRAARSGFSVRVIGVGSAETPDEIVTAFASAMRPETRVLSFSDLSNISGLQLPTAALCRLARERGIYVHVDGAQTLGGTPRDLHALGCDSYSASAHKWLMGPKEAGILFVRANRIPEIWPSVVGVGWGNGAETSARGIRKLETLGQRNDATLAGLLPTLDLHQEIGTATIAARITELATLLKDGISRIPTATLVTPRAPELSGGVVVTTFPGKDTRSIYQRLYDRHRIAGASTGGVRLCPHIYTTRADVERVIEALGREAAAA